MEETLGFPKYSELIEQLKQRIRTARLEAVITINGQMLAIYWEIGNTIAKQEHEEGWGKKIVETLAKDLKIEFPEIKGFSPRNLRYMRDFALTYPDFPNLQAPPAKLKNVAQVNESTILQASLAKLTWYHHITLLDKVKNLQERQFYIDQTAQNGWSRNIMVHQIESGLYRRQGQILNNFKQTIAQDQSELIQQLFKDPYKFDFIYLGKEAKERDLEDALVNQLTRFLIELGQWFAFMGRQYRVTVGERDYFYDLLFYHTRLKRYIVIELKVDEFKPEYKGKMDYYLTIADEQLKTSSDDPSIGLILCKTKDGLVAEYALRDSSKPIGIAEYTLNEFLPENIKGELPTIEELEKEIEKGYEELNSPSKTDNRDNILEVELVNLIKDASIAEFNAYKAIPDVSMTNLEKFYVKHSSAWKFIYYYLLEKRDKKLIIANEFNSSDNYIYYVKIISSSSHEAVIQTKEYWRLDWYSEDGKKYINEELYNLANTQLYTVIKDEGTWKINKVFVPNVSDKEHSFP